jgi:hypothetical protein
MEAWGLILNTVGVVILAVAQNRLDGAIRCWLVTLDFSVETMLAPAPAPMVRVHGMDEQTKRTLVTNRWLSTLGWIVTGVGFILQLAALHSHQA